MTQVAGVGGAAVVGRCTTFELIRELERRCDVLVLVMRGPGLEGGQSVALVGPWPSRNEGAIEAVRIATEAIQDAAASDRYREVRV